MKKTLAVFTALFMMLGIFAFANVGLVRAESTEAEETAAENAAPASREADTLVIATDGMNEIFNAHDTHTVPDRLVTDLVQGINLIEFDEKAQPTSEGISEYNEPEIIGEGDNQEVIYKFKIKDGIKFSDGTPVTADDVIFNFKYLLDPKYVGDSTLYTCPIIGALEYKYDDADYQKKLDEIAQQVKDYQPTDEEIKAKAQSLFDEYKVDMPELKLEDFLKDGVHFEEETLKSLVKDKETTLMSEYIDANLADGLQVTDIEGIKKISDSELEVHLNRLDPVAVYKLSFNIIPKSYYGEGFEKGKIDVVRAKEKQPMGGGPFIFKGYSANVVSLEANPNFYKGEPKIKNLKLQVVAQTNKLESVARGETDISEPAASPDMVKEAESKENVHSELVDNNGYGYIGINAKRVTDKLVRQGLMHLMDRKTAVNAYYGELASVIERPMSRVNWAYPESATEYYGFNPEKALEKFKEAGYEQVDGKLVKDGKQLHLTVAYPGGDDDNHPVKPVFTTLKTEAEKLGAIIDLQNMQATPFFAALDAGTLDMWAAAWQATPDPDMTQVYSSTSPGNKYGLNNKELDEIIANALKTVKVEERKELYAKALDIVMDEAVEMPFYQRKNLFVYNQDVIDIDTLPEVLTPYWNHINTIYNLELVE